MVFSPVYMPAESLSIIFGRKLPLNLGVVTGAISGNLFAADIDRLDKVDWFDRQLDRLNIDTWQRSSQRGRHYYFRSLDGPVQSENRRTQGYQILGEGGIVAVPPSLLGDNANPVYWVQQPDLLPTAIHIDDLPFLRLTSTAHKRRSIDKLSLPYRANQVLCDKNIGRYGGDNSSAEYAACLSLWGAGWSRQRILDIFAWHNPPHYKKVGKENFARYILDQAIANSKASNARQHQEFVDTYLDRLSRTPFPGHKGNSQKAVLEGMAYRMAMDNAEEFRASEREVSELSGKDRKTVRKTIADLISLGHLDRITGRGTRDAAQYRLNDVLDPVALPENIMPAQKALLEGVRVSDDAFHHRALRMSSYFILQYLCRTEAATQYEIHLATGKAISTISEGLRILQRSGFVTCDEGRYSMSVDADTVLLNQISRQAGTWGRGAARAEQNRRDRQINIVDSILRAIKRMEHDWGFR
jgi:predicted transcriptional regulator